MRKRMIVSVFVLFVMLSVTGLVFAKQHVNVKNSGTFVKIKRFNENKMIDIKPSFISSEHHSGSDYKNSSNPGKSGDYIQGLIMAPMLITRTICENSEIISS